VNARQAGKDNPGQLLKKVNIASSNHSSNLLGLLYPFTGINVAPSMELAESKGG